MDSTQLRNIAFLMSLGGLSVACPGDEKGETDSDGDSGRTTGTASMSTTGTPTTSGSTGDGTGTDGGTTTTGETTQTPTSGTTGAVTESTGDSSAGFITTDSTTDMTGSTTDEPPPAPEVPVCTDFGDKFAMCFPQYRNYGPYYAMYCNEIFAAGGGDGPDCTAALEEFFVCMNGLECMALEGELTGRMPVACADPWMTVNAACPSFGGP